MIGEAANNSESLCHLIETRSSLRSLFIILFILVLADIIPQYKEVHDFWLNNSGPDSLSMSVADFSKALYTNYNSVIEEQYSIKSDKGKLYKLVLIPSVPST